MLKKHIINETLRDFKCNNITKEHAITIFEYTCAHMIKGCSGTALKIIDAKFNDNIRICTSCVFKHIGCFLEYKENAEELLNLIFPQRKIKEI